MFPWLKYFLARVLLIPWSFYQYQFKYVSSKSNFNVKSRLKFPLEAFCQGENSDMDVLGKLSYLQTP